MISLSNLTYEDEAGKWDFEIDEDPAPKGNDSDCEILLVKVLSPTGAKFTYKFRFSLTDVATENLNYGTREERVTAAFKNSIDAIFHKHYGDMVFTSRRTRWKRDDAPRSLLKHS